MIALALDGQNEGGIEKYITASLLGAELEEVILLASNFSRGALIKEYQILGAAGQLLVRKAFPQLMVNGLKYENGDGWRDYLEYKIDTKTCMVNGSFVPHLWVRKDLVCDRLCEECFSDKKRCRPLLVAPAQIYIGVEMDQYRERAVKWSGRIFGFSTARRLQELYRISPELLKHSTKNHSVGYPASTLFSMWTLFYYLKNRHNPSAHVQQYLSCEDLDVMDACFRE